jgi:hypothetical protein
MNPELAHRAEDIFYDLLGVDPGAAGTRIARSVRRRFFPPFRGTVAPEGAPRTRAFMDTARARELASQAQAAPLSNGERVAGYTIRGIMGMGGMGVVYVADQDRPRRTVALKVIRRGFATDAIVRRFEHEAEVLGLLQHPASLRSTKPGSRMLFTRAPLPSLPWSW